MSETNERLIADLNKSMAIELPPKISFAELEDRLAAYVNDLVGKDFEKLVSLLYRIDVSEAKLKNLLQVHKDENAGKIIAQLILERQQQKIKSREQFTKKKTDDENETW